MFRFIPRLLLRPTTLAVLAIAAAWVGWWLWPERPLTVLLKIGEQDACLVHAGCLHTGHHVPHQLAEVAFAPHARHHALEYRRPLRRVMHRRAGKVVALNAIPDEKARTARVRLGQFARLEGGRKNALEHRAVRALGPALLRLLDQPCRILRARGRGGEDCGEDEHGDARHAANYTDPEAAFMRSTPTEAS